MYYVISLIVGLVIGGLVTSVYIFHKPAGYMVIDLTNPEKDIYRIEMEIPLEKIPGRKFLILGVNSQIKQSL